MLPYVGHEQTSELLHTCSYFSPGAFISVNWLHRIYTGTAENRMSFLATSSSSKLEGKIIIFNRRNLF